MSDYKFILTQIKKAIHNYQMIMPHDFVAVGLSGGKDSMGLLYLLHELQIHSHLNVRLCAIHLDYGWGNEDGLSLLKDFALSMNIPCYIEKINYPAERAVSCSVCARVRRGALLKKAQNLGVNKLALAHHLDDAMQTVLLNLTDGGRFRSFRPTIAYPEQNLTLIRPLIYVNESSLIRLKDEQHLPIIPSHCPLGECTNRSNAAQLLSALEKTQPHIKQKILHALEHLEADDAWVK